MAVTALWLTDFRCFSMAELHPDPDGLTVLRGPNGAGKTSVLEAVGWLALQRSVRGVPRAALVRRGTARSVIRAETSTGDRVALVESEIPLEGPARLQVNRQAVRRRSTMADVLDVTLFAPDDLRLVQGGPAARREYLDEVLATRHPRLDVLCGEVDRILRQRAAVLRQAGARLGKDIALTLDVWDDRFARAGSALAEERENLVVELAPLVSAAYMSLVGGDDTVSLHYRRSWDGDLATALGSARSDDVRRQVTTVGPHRDELELAVDGRPARTQASQGEQRCTALALRLASHELRRAARAEPPVLLLDDVFSELDPIRAAALVALLPPGQVLLTTAVDPPGAVRAHSVVQVVAGSLGPPAWTAS